MGILQMKIFLEENAMIGEKKSTKIYTKTKVNKKSSSGSIDLKENTANKPLKAQDCI